MWDNYPFFLETNTHTMEREEVLAQRHIITPLKSHNNF